MEADAEVQLRTSPFSFFFFFFFFGSTLSFLHFLPFPFLVPLSYSSPFASFSFKRTHPKKKVLPSFFFKGFFCYPLSLSSFLFLSSFCSLFFGFPLPILSTHVLRNVLSTHVGVWGQCPHYIFLIFFFYFIFFFIFFLFLLTFFFAFFLLFFLFFFSKLQIKIIIK